MLLASLRRLLGVRSVNWCRVGGVASGVFGPSRAKSMASDVEREAILSPLRLAVREQGDKVRQMKAEGIPKLELNAALSELRVRKKTLEEREKALAPPEESFDRSALEDLLKQRFFYAPAFSIYGGVAGLYDFGPMGCALKANIISLWRQHFVLEEGMLELDCTVLTPETVLRASGHVERFTDIMVSDTVTRECYRCDHLLEEHLRKLLAGADTTPEQAKEYQDVTTKVDTYDCSELAALLQKFDVRAPTTSNPLSPPHEFNLMFGTSVGPAGSLPSFLRPETAQGIFVNFKRLLEFNNGKLPFAAAQIGRAFRNEISPRAGLLRVREFDLAEIEHFVNPEHKQKFAKFSQVADLVLTLFSSCNQLDGSPSQQMTLREAVDKGLVANEILGYYMGRIYQFLMKVGVAPEKFRFRQHMSNEMAHYAKDCWDAECRTSYGWVECVGCADRSCYDLDHHSKVSKVELSAKEDLPEPRVVSVVECVPEKGVLGKTFRKEAKAVMEWMGRLSEEEVADLERKMAEEGSYEASVDGKTFALLPNMVNIKRYQKTIHVVDVVPSVIEPSFGIGRVMYSVLEHCFRVREGDEKRSWLELPPTIAPISCSVLPLSGNDQFTPYVTRIADSLRGYGVSHKVDDSSGSIGRRYARTDAIGIPFGVTVDFDTLKTDTATLRERNSTRQIRAKVSELAEVVCRLVRGEETWESVERKFPKFTAQESTQ